MTIRPSEDTWDKLDDVMDFGQKSNSSFIVLPFLILVFLFSSVLFYQLEKVSIETEKKAVVDNKSEVDIVLMKIIKNIDK
ncbi:hypothetical protein [Flavobacterium lacustre]|uniref:hypothetical protein n=1 Tax=Flavobacterium lacustre TaxID=3016339 RepID=UPI0022B6B30B|nr:hypothetical protein [Flavobacterium lacustre]